jgi:hypothetical protein
MANIFNPACELLHPWTKELYLCTVAPLACLWPPPPSSQTKCTVYTYGGFIKCILRGVRCTKSLRVLFLHRRPPSWTTLVLYSRAVFIFNEPTFSVWLWGGRVLNCAVDHILQEFYSLFLTRFRTYKIASPPQTKITSKDDMKGLVSLKFLRPWTEVFLWSVVLIGLDG